MAETRRLQAMHPLITDQSDSQRVQPRLELDTWRHARNHDVHVAARGRGARHLERRLHALVERGVQLAYLM